MHTDTTPTSHALADAGLAAFVAAATSTDPLTVDDVEHLRAVRPSEPPSDRPARPWRT